MVAMQFPLVSIVVCVYNGERFLKEQLESLLCQTYPHLEIVITDDASTDASRSVIASYSGDPRVRVFYQERNLGYLGNIAFGAAKARGVLICFADQDDVWLVDKVEKLYNALGDYSLVYSDSKLVDEKGNYLGRNLSDLRRMYTGDDSRGFILDNVVSGHTVMVRKEVVASALPIPQGFYHDEWLAIRAVTGRGIVYLDKALTLYRQHDTTITKTLMDKRPASRERQRRYEDFQKQLRRIKMIMDSERPDRKPFYEKLYDLFMQKSKGTFAWSLFFFLLKNQKSIFMFSKKSMISRVIEIRKLSRGESPGL